MSLVKVDSCASATLRKVIICFWRDQYFLLCRRGCEATCSLLLQSLGLRRVEDRLEAQTFAERGVSCGVNDSFVGIPYWILYWVEKIGLHSLTGDLFSDLVLDGLHAFFDTLCCFFDRLHAPIRTRYSQSIFYLILDDSDHMFSVSLHYLLIRVLILKLGNLPKLLVLLLLRQHWQLPHKTVLFAAQLGRDHFCHVVLLHLSRIDVRGVGLEDGSWVPPIHPVRRPV